MSKRCKGVCRAVFRVLAREYATLSDDELADLRRDGQEACNIHRIGGISFGKASREISRAARRDLCAQRALAMVNDELTTLALAQAFTFPKTVGPSSAPGSISPKKPGTPNEFRLYSHRPPLFRRPPPHPFAAA